MSHQDTHHTPMLHEAPDPWHRHSSEEGMPQAEHGSRAKPAALATAFAIIVLSVVALILSVLVYAVKHFSHVRSQQYETTALAEEAVEYRNNLRQNELQTYGWADSEHVRIPIDVAIEKVVQTYSESARADAR